MPFFIGEDNITVGDIITFLEREVPPVLAEDWDNSGLQLGNPSKQVSAILVALNATAEALQEAGSRQANLLITHHPLLFSPLKTINLSQPTAQVVEMALAAGTAVYSAHTTWDRAFGGVNDALAEALGLTVTGFLEEGPRERMAKLVVFAPKEAVSQVRDALFDDRAGVIGRYSHCSYSLDGEGSYMPLEGADPYVGEQGKLEKADEVRLEVIAPRRSVSQVLERVRAVHPYEEMAYDVYPLLNPTHRGGMGRMARLPKPMNLGQLIEDIKVRLNLNRIKFVGSRDREVCTVALCGGAGSSLWGEALARGADVYISGEFRYHEALEARSKGLALVDIGHFASEFPGVRALAGRVESSLPSGHDIAIYTYEGEKDVFQFI